MFLGALFVPLPASRTLFLTESIVRSFLDQVLFGKKWPALKSRRSPWPEVKVTKVYG